MANYIPFARSNYFKVKDVEAFKKFCEEFDLELITDNPVNVESPECQYGFICPESIPDQAYRKYIDETGTEVEAWVDVDFSQELAKQLAAGEVAVYQEIGYEKMRYLVGFAVAVNSQGATKMVSIDDIYEIAKELGNCEVTCCSY